MNLQITGHHLEVTPALRDYVNNKLDKVTRHFDHVIDVSVILSVEKLKQKAEVTLHVRGKDIHVESDDTDLYAAVDLLIDVGPHPTLLGLARRVLDERGIPSQRRGADPQ